MRALFITAVALVVAVAGMPSDALAAFGGRTAVGSSVEVKLEETIEGDVVVVGGQAVIAGRVDGDLVVVLGSVELGPEARVGGDFVHLAGRREVDPEAVVVGQRVTLASSVADPPDLRAQLPSRSAPSSPNAGLPSLGPPAAKGQIAPSFEALFALFSVGLWWTLTAAVLVVGLFFRTAWPERSKHIRSTVAASWASSLLIGSLATLGAVQLGALLVLSVVGWLALPLLIVGMTLCWTVGLSSFAETLGGVLPLRLGGGGSQLLVGILLLALLGLYAGTGFLAAVLASSIGGLVGAIGIGACLLSGFGKRHYGRTLGQ